MTNTNTIKRTAEVARHVSGVIDSWPMKDHVLIAANDKGARALVSALGTDAVDPVPAGELPRLPNVDWSALRGERGESRTFRVGRLDARGYKALAVAAEGDHTAA